MSFIVVGTPFYPIIDGQLQEKAFLPQSLEVLGENLPDDIYALIGQTSADGTVFAFPSK